MADTICGYQVYRVAPVSDYREGEAGFVVERIYDWNDDFTPRYGLMDWIERGLPHLEGVFPTERAALEAIAA